VYVSVQCITYYGIRRSDLVSDSLSLSWKQEEKWKEKTNIVQCTPGTLHKPVEDTTKLFQCHNIVYVSVYLVYRLRGKMNNVPSAFVHLLSIWRTRSSDFTVIYHCLQRALKASSDALKIWWHSFPSIKKKQW